MPGKIIRDLLTLLQTSPHTQNLKVKDARIGISYTGVVLDNGAAGICYTMQSELRCCEKTALAGTIVGSPALTIAHLADSWNLYETVLGIATINALSSILLQKKPRSYTMSENVNCIEHIDINKDDVVALVGYMKPFITKIKSKTTHLFILERSLQTDEHMFPDTACDDLVPQADIVIITGTALINGTIEHLLDLAQDAREIILVGPTASMYPQPLFKRGVTLIGGVEITNVPGMLQIISEGGGVPQLKKVCKQITMHPT